MDKDQLLHVEAVDYLLRNPNVVFEGDRGRLAGLNATLTGSFTDDLIEKAPSAIRTLIERNDSSEATDLLGKLQSRHGTEWKRRNYGFDVEGHHPLSIGGSHLLASDMSMRDAQTVYEIGRLNGLEHGTKSEYMLPITRVGHDLAHLDVITHKTNKSGFQADNALFRQRDPEARAMAALPLNLLEQSISKLAYHTPQEQQVRRFAAQLVGITPEQLVSLERNPNYKTPTGRDGGLSYVAAAKKGLGKEEMAKALISGYGANASMSDIITPNQMRVRFKSPNRPDEYRDRRSMADTYLAQTMAKFRPGQEDNILRLIRRGRKNKPDF